MSSTLLQTALLLGSFSSVAFAGQCLTTGGAKVGVPCVFPFKARGITYTTCTKAGGFDIPWCSTMVDANGDTVLGNYGDCPTDESDPNCYPSAATDAADATTAQAQGSCLTTGGSKVGVPCVFPFKARGVTYTSCTFAGGFSTPWCSTMVDANGDTVLGNWGDCPVNDPTCPNDASTAAPETSPAAAETSAAASETSPAAESSAAASETSPAAAESSAAASETSPAAAESSAAASETSPAAAESSAAASETSPAAESSAAASETSPAAAESSAAASETSPAAAESSSAASETSPAAAESSAAASETSPAAAETSADATTVAPCLTVSGAKVGVACVFPFTTRGKTYTSCTVDGGYTTPWCSTMVDANGETVLGNWGECPTDDPNCPNDITTEAASTEAATTEAATSTAETTTAEAPPDGGAPVRKLSLF